MVRHVTDLREQIERDVVQGRLAPDLVAVFDRAERGLALHAMRFRSLKTNSSGHIVRSVQNIEHALAMVTRMDSDLQKWVVDPGTKWANRALPILERAGTQMAVGNLEVQYLSQDYINATFDHIPRGVNSALRVGKERIVEIVGTVGKDVQNWFRNEMLDAITEGVPLQGPGDSLANRLIQSGRIRPTVIQTKHGRTIRRSITTRANAIARVESSRILGDVHMAYAQDALGDDAVYTNSNPTDSRTTDVCQRASQQKPMTLAQWAASPFGRAPRFSPFHLCRSHLIGGKREWFGAEGVEPKRRSKPPPPPPPPKRKPQRKRKRPEVKPEAKSKVTDRAVEQVAKDQDLHAADLALARNQSAPIQDRIAAYGRARGNAKIAQIKALGAHGPAAAAKDLERAMDAVDKEIAALTERNALAVREQGRLIREGNLRVKYPLSEDMRKAVPRIQELWDEQGAIRTRVMDLGNKKDGLAAQLAAAGNAPDSLRAQVVNVLRTEGDGIGKSNPSRPRKPKTSSDFDQRQYERHLAAADRAEEGRDFTSALLDPRATTTGKAHDVKWNWTQSERADATRGIAGKPHRIRANRNVGKAGKIDGLSTAVHEYGHTVEYATGTGDLSKQFFRHRIGPDADLQSMYGWGFKHYTDGELTNPDRFIDIMRSWAKERAEELAAYAGKQYTYDATEILSMGLQALHRDPVGFVTKDPEWANYLFGVLDGGYRPG